MDISLESAFSVYSKLSKKNQLKRKKNKLNKLKIKNKELAFATDNKKKKKNSGKSKKPLKMKSNNLFMKSERSELVECNHSEIALVKDNQLLNQNHKTNVQNKFSVFPNKLNNGLHLLSYILHPFEADYFMSNFWEKKPLYIKREMETYYSGLLTTEDIDCILRNNNVYYTDNLDVTLYVDGERETLNPDGRAEPHVVWDFYAQQCSVRLLNPQLYLDNVHFLNVTLQDYFGSYVGSNTYLTPPDSQGFAPHYDDIEAFILQLEGKKYWKVYEPRTEAEVLPRYSSPNFNVKDIGTPMMEVELVPGDLLYLPRGYIHQACTDSENHSLHITVSVYQRNAYVDLLEKVIPAALKSASQNDVEYRRGLPLNFLEAAGFSHDKKLSKTRTHMINTMKTLINKLTDYINIDDAVDELGVHFIHCSLPPFLTPEEKLRSQLEGGTRILKNGELKLVQLNIDSEVKLISRYACRLTKSLNFRIGKSTVEYRLYYTTQNLKEYQGQDANFAIIPNHMVKCVQYLIRQYAIFVPIRTLPHSDLDEKLKLVSDLWELNILLTSAPLCE